MQRRPPMARTPPSSPLTSFVECPGLQLAPPALKPRSRPLPLLKIRPVDPIHKNPTQNPEHNRTHPDTPPKRINQIQRHILIRQKFNKQRQQRQNQHPQHRSTDSAILQNPVDPRIIQFPNLITRPDFHHTHNPKIKKTIKANLSGRHDHPITIPAATKLTTQI